MDVRTINTLLSRGEYSNTQMWPRKMEIESKGMQFRFEFGLDSLPEEPGVILIRGPRQYGKSTWLELNLHDSIKRYGPGSTYYLNGDELGSHEQLAQSLVELDDAFSKDARVKRLFIDEITAVTNWEKGLKRVLDRGLLRDVLIVTTGSKALDLRRASERLPGRKGKIARSEYIFLPISYKEFHRYASHKFHDKTWMAYLLSGGSPIACYELCRTGYLPEYFIQLTRDWIFGDVIATGRSRVALTGILRALFERGGLPVGYAKLAREAALANNTVASGYVEQLSDLLCLLPSWPWDLATNKLILRKPCKFHFINMGAVTSLHPASLRSIEEFQAMPPDTQGMFIEWLIAQEVWRREVLQSMENAESIGFWSNEEHEIDFVTPSGKFLEVKRGKAGPLDFAWFPKIFGNRQLVVVCRSAFQTQHVRGITLENFLLQGLA